MVLDLVTGQAEHWGQGGEVTWVDFLPNGLAFVTMMDCEGGYYYFVWDLQTGKSRFVAAGGIDMWNADESAFASDAGNPYYLDNSSVSVYSWVSDRDISASEGENNEPVWTPDGNYVLYQHRPLTKTGESVFTTVTFGPRDIRLIDVARMEIRILAGDPQHDYHADCSCFSCPWWGDWVSVWRMPYHSRSCPELGDCDTTCLYGGGGDCPEPQEHWALNWRTGELVPWEEASPPTPVAPTARPKPTPTSTPLPGPDLSRPPVYSAPDNRYALYVGADEHSLWCVTSGKSPILWIDQGFHFLYIP